MILANLMMKMNFKKITIFAFSVFVTACLALPVFAISQVGEGSPALKGFCSRISELTLKVDQRINDREAKLEKKHQENLDKFAVNKSERNAKKEEGKDKRDANRQEHYSALEAKATTDAQKQALAVFESTVEAAITARQTTIDATIASFQADIKRAMDNRKVAVDAAVSEFKNAEDLAIDKAISDCASGIDQKTVRATFIASMKTARDKFQSNKQAIEKLRASFEPLRATRKAAIDKAIQDFKIAIEGAKNELKIALGQK